MRIGLFPRRRRLLSLRQAQLRTDGRIYVPLTREQILAAPSADAGDLLDPARRAALEAGHP